jgi:hypothetical protein
VGGHPERLGVHVDEAVDLGRIEVGAPVARHRPSVVPDKVRPRDERGASGPREKQSDVSGRAGLGGRRPDMARCER